MLPDAPACHPLCLPCLQAAWIGGTGCVPLHNLMEDAATAEISRAQVGTLSPRCTAHLCSGACLCLLAG